MKNSGLRKNGIVILLFIALLAASVWTFASYSAPPVQNAALVEESTLVFRPDYEIVAKKGIRIWPEGSVLEQGRAAYFYAALPVVKITPSLEIIGMKQGELLGSVKSSIIIRALNDKGELFWTYSLMQFPPAPVKFTSADNGQTQRQICRAPLITMDVKSATEEIVRISEELSFKSAVFQLVCLSEIKVNGTVNDKTVQKTIINALPLSMKEESFTIPKTENAVTSEKLTFNNTPKTPPQPTLGEKLRKNPLPILLDIVLLILLLIVIRKSKRKSITPDLIERRKYREWITEGSIQLKDRAQVNVHSLQGLVDLAIDLDKRVIYDPDKGTYFVLEENLAYLYNSEKTKAILNTEKLQLGKLLLERGLLRPEQLEMGLYHQQKVGTRLGESLMTLGLIDEVTLYSTLAAQANLPYIELNPEMHHMDARWQNEMFLKQARALGALPLGVRNDGKMVIACSNPGKEGIRKALEELFDQEFIIVIARPSMLYRMIEKLEVAEEQKRGIIAVKNLGCQEPIDNLMPEEIIRFNEKYMHGIVILEILLKAADFVRASVISRVPEKELLLQWLVSNGYMDPDTAHLLIGLQRAVMDMDYLAKKDRHKPDLLDVLVKAHYLTSEDMEWFKKEMYRQSKTLDDLLKESLLVERETLEKAKCMLEIVEIILNKNPD